MITLINGDSSKYQGTADLVFTNPYAPLPKQLHKTPAIINLYERDHHRRDICEHAWMGGATLEHVSSWGINGYNNVYVANMDRIFVDLSDLEEDTRDAPPDWGWFPHALVIRLLRAYGLENGGERKRRVVWDGFAGRGTVGVGCVAMGHDFIGIEKDLAIYQRMRIYLQHYSPKEATQHGSC